MEDTKYNGWSNYETWLCKLWLDNEQVTYSLMLNLAKNARKEAKADKTGAELNELGRLSLDIETFIESERDDYKGASLFSDLMTHAIAQIDFREIAAAYLEELAN